MHSTFETVRGLHSPGRIRASAIRALQAGAQMLYAMRLADGSIKIGCSRDVVDRKWRFPSAEVIALMPGGFADERALHRLLTEHAIHGREFYAPTPEVMTVVNWMREYYKLGPLEV